MFKKLRVHAKAAKKKHAKTAKVANCCPIITPVMAEPAHRGKVVNFPKVGNFNLSPAIASAKDGHSKHYKALFKNISKIFHKKCT